MKRLLTFLLLTAAAFAQEAGTTSPWHITDNGSVITTGGPLSEPLTVNGLQTNNGGLTIQILSAPSGLSAVQLASSGGFLLHNQAYFYKLTCTNATGETTVSGEATFTTSASPTPDTYSATITWNADTGCTGYKLYRSTTTNTELLLATISGGATISYTDNTNTTPSGAVPATNTTSQIVAPVNAVGNPSYSFVGNLTSGFYFAGGAVRTAVGGTNSTVSTATQFFAPMYALDITNADVGISRLAADTIAFGNGTASNDTAIIVNSGMRVALTADWTMGTGGTVTSAGPNIIGSGGGVPLTFTLPLLAKSYKFECDLIVGQATAATANTWSLLTATNGATNVTAGYQMGTAATAMAVGAVTDQTSTTTAFAIAPNWTLGGTATKMPVHIWAEVEGASASGTVLSLELTSGAVADLITIYRGSNCTLK